jgi:arsenate reductase (thioredoxin)
MLKLKTLFVCVHNGGRSQMAEAFANRYGASRVHAESAGLEPGELNPLVVQAMQEIGIDISQNQTKSVVEKFRAGEHYHYVIAVCSPEAAEKCPIFPGVSKRLHWPFDDPARVTGTEEEKLNQVRRIRDQIKKNVFEWLDELGATL